MPYTGRYESGLDPFDVSIHDGKLVLQQIPKGGYPFADSPPRRQPPVRELAFTGADGVLVVAPPFLRGERAQFYRRDGEIVGLRWGGRIRARRTS